jgi:hypothetical protein
LLLVCLFGWLVVCLHFFESPGRSTVHSHPRQVGLCVDDGSQQGSGLARETVAATRTKP